MTGLPINPEDQANLNQQVNVIKPTAPEEIRLNNLLVGAIQRSAIDEIDDLVKLGANLHDDNVGFAVCHAAFRCRFNIVESLLKHNARIHPDKPNPYSNAMILATQANSPQMLGLLKNYGVNLNFFDKLNKINPLLTAIRFNYIDCLQCLIQLGADVNFQHDKSETPLIYAIRHTPSMAPFLISNGADVNLDAQFSNPLTEAISRNEYDIAKLLIKHGADVNAQIGIKDQVRISMVRFGALQRFSRYTSLLLDNGAKINPDNDISPLISATNFNSIENVTLLIDRGIDLNAQDLSGKTALMRAVIDNRMHLVKTLLSAGADTSIKDLLGFSALDMSREENGIKAITDLVELYMLNQVSSQSSANLVKQPDSQSIRVIKKIRI